MVFNDLELSMDALQGRYRAILSDPASGAFRDSLVTPARVEQAVQYLASEIGPALRSVQGAHATTGAMLDALANAAAGSAALSSKLQALLALAFIHVYAWENRPDNSSRLYSDAVDARNEIRRRAREVLLPLARAVFSVDKPMGGRRGGTTSVPTEIWP